MVHELVLLFLIFGLIWLIIEVATVMFRLTGLDGDTARFQAISIITSSGYTTAEAELIARHPLRRKVAMFLMISGTLSLAFIISLLVRIFGSGFSGPNNIFLLLLALLAIYLLFRNPRFIRFYEQHLERSLARQASLHRRGIEELLRLEGKYSIAEILLANPESPLAGKTLSQVRLRDRGVLVLSIRRKGETIRLPRGTDKLLSGDVLLVFGRPEHISRLTRMVT